MKKKLPKPVVPQDLVERMRKKAQEPLPVLSKEELEQCKAQMASLGATKH